MEQSSNGEVISKSKPKKPGILKRISNAITGSLENGFCTLGVAIGKRPLIAILSCLVVTGLIGVGFLRFKETTEQNKLWVPIGADIVNQQNWVSDNYPSTTRFANIIVAGGNVISKASILALYDIYESVLNATSSGGHKLADVCLKIGPTCRVNSILELWSFNKANIESQTDQEILDTVNSVTTSPVYYNPYDVKTVLGQRTSNGTYISLAQATQMSWILLGDDATKDKTEDFELQIIEIGKAGVSGLGESYVFTGRSFSDEGGGAILGDVSLLSAGYFVLIIFVILVLGRFNFVEQRVGLAIAGILCVGLSIAVSFGLASIVGAEYGPLHSVLPFLLLGIGVDDMFVIVGALNNLNPEEIEMEIPEKVGRILRHAGVSVTVTSLTDIVAFAIGATTILPALRSFCEFACFGILGLYITQTVFFTACLTLDLKRMGSLRDGCICCYKHTNWHPNKCSKYELIPMYFRKIHGPYLAKLPVKIVVMVVTLAVFAANIYGLINLRQDFDPSWFLPTDGYAFKYFKAQEKYFPDDGATGYIYCGNINYYVKQTELTNLYNTVSSNKYILNGTVDSWFEAYKASASATSDEASFIQAVFDWAHAPANARILRDVNFVNTSATATDITATRIAFQHKALPEAGEQVEAMDEIRRLVKSILPECFPYSRNYGGWETNKLRLQVIQEELYRNLGLAFACVFVVTLILIANILTSILVLTCVTFTLVNVGGCMYFWGLTIDTVTSVILVLAIGLAVDYSAHIGLQFMTIRGSRKERMLETVTEMGPPVFNGGFSTFLAFVLLAVSNSYVFTTFFKVFLLVVCFGLFHGLVYLPVVLSWIGPSPYMTADHVFHSKPVEVDPADKMEFTNREAVHIGSPTPESAKSNEGMANGCHKANSYSPEKTSPIPNPDNTSETAKQSELLLSDL